MQPSARKPPRRCRHYRAAAATTARSFQQRADHALGLQPSKSADLCASMQAMGDEWLQGRARP